MKKGKLLITDKSFIINFFPVIFLFILTIIIAGFFASIGADPDGHGVIKPAIDIARGKFPFRDTYTMYGVLTLYLQAFSIKLFGEYLLSIQWLTVFFYGMISVLLWLIWSRILPKYLTFISCLIWLFLAPYYVTYFLFHPWSSVYALFFQLLAVYLIVLYLERQQKKLIFLSGISAALTFWCRQPVGLLLFIAIFGFIFLLNIYGKFILKNKNINFINLLWLVFGFGSGICIFLVWFMANSALKDFWIQSFEVPYWISKNQPVGGMTLNNIITNLFPGSYSFVSIWSVMPLLIIVFLFFLVILFLTKKKKEINLEIILFLCIISVASWSQYYPTSCVRHVYWAATPMVGLFVYIVYNFINKINISKNKSTNKIIFAIVLILFFGKDIKFRLIMGVNKLNETYVIVEEPSILKNIKLKTDEFKYYKYIDDLINYYITNFPNSKIIPYGEDALYLTFNKNIDSFHKSYYHYDSFTDIVYPDFSEKFSEYVIKNKPLILTSDPNLIIKHVENKNLLSNYCIIFNGKYWYNRVLYILSPCENAEKIFPKK